MIRLFIENKEIEIDNSVQVAITKQFEDLTNPTVIINDWSKTVSIPFTQRNNEIFGHIYNPDKLIVEGGTVGIYFNPLKKLDFRIEWNNAVLMTGYAKMNEVKQVSGKGTYEITLFGQLGKIFQEMQKITFDTSTSEQDYLIDGSDYVDEYITKELVYNSWTSTGQTHSSLEEKWISRLNPETMEVIVTPNHDYNVTDIIGFAPNNSFSDGFDYKTLQTSNYDSQELTDVLGNIFKSNTGVEPSTAIPNGLLPREYGEYRSYLQLPYIYWNKLFQVFQKKAESITGYKFDLDSDWFNGSNPYWYDLVYMLKSFDLKGEEMVEDIYNVICSPITFIGTQSSGYTQLQTTPFVFSGAVSEPVPIVDYVTGVITLSDEYTLNINTEYAIEFNQNNYEDLRINPANALNYQIIITDSTGSYTFNKIDCLIVDNDYTGNTENYNAVFRCGQVRKVWRFYPQYKFSLDKGKYGSSVKIWFGARWLNDVAPFLYNGQPFFTEQSTALYFNRTVANSPKFNIQVVKNSHRSYKPFTLNDLWNKDYNLFNEILKYCKIYRIGIFADDIKKKIKFIPLYKYFVNYTVTDWTDKIDKSKDYTIKPVTFENKYVLFNYTDSKTKLGENYREKYGVNYGEYRLVTDYNFNDSTTKLFDDIKTSIVSTDNILSWTNLKNNNKIIYSFPNEISVYNKDKDGKENDMFGAYFFRNGTAQFNTETTLYMRDVYITDDTIFQNSNSNFFFIDDNIQDDYKKRVYTYPKLDIVKGDNLCVFNVPKENYTYLNNYTGKASIYTNFWQKYLDERYNVQNKMITCYVDLKPHEYNQFAFNQLVKVGNQLCIVNKIYDYDITANHTTKVDLITIQDIEGYTTDNY